MDIAIIIGYFAALFIGISLGIIGGGGSILTVPVLVYLLGIDAVTSTAYSLFIVGATALVGAIRSYISKNLDLRTGIQFAVPALVGVWLTRAFLIPLIPNVIFSTDSWVLTKDVAILLFFAFIMLLSSYSMIKSGKTFHESENKTRTTKDNIRIIVDGSVVGVVTGIVGAGGGFLIIPALVILAKVPMKLAVGTSLMIIAIKSLIGFTGDLLNPEIVMDWDLLFVFTALSIVGIYIGIGIRSHISSQNLKKGFGYFLLLMGIYMMAERIINM